MEHSKLVLRRQKEVHEKLALLLQREPQLTGSQISITKIKLSNDFAWAKIYYLLLGKASTKPTEIAKSAVIQVQNRLAKILNYKKNPKLLFVYDTSFDHAMRIESLLDSLHPDESKKSNGESKL